MSCIMGVSTSKKPRSSRNRRITEIILARVSNVLLVFCDNTKSKWRSLWKERNYGFHIFHLKKITFLRKQQSFTELRSFRPIDVFKISIFPFIIHLLTVMQVLKISKCQLPWKRNDFLLNVFLVVFERTKFHGDKWFNLHENTPFFHTWLIYLGSVNRRPFNYIFERCNWSKRVNH